MMEKKKESLLDAFTPIATAVRNMTGSSVHGCFQQIVGTLTRIIGNRRISPRIKGRANDKTQAHRMGVTWQVDGSLSSPNAAIDADARCARNNDCSDDSSVSE